MLKNNQRLKASSNLLAVIALLTASPSIIYQEARAADALSSFKFEGIGLSTTFSDFHRRYPSATFLTKQSEEKVGLRCYLVLQTKTADGAEFMFLDGKLYGVTMLYYPARLNRLGGADALYDKLSRMFGANDDYQATNDGFNATWDHPEHNRRAIMTMAPDCASLIVIDTGLQDVLIKRRAQRADFGFGQ